MGVRHLTALAAGAALLGLAASALVRARFAQGVSGDGGVLAAPLAQPVPPTALPSAGDSAPEPEPAAAAPDDPVVPSSPTTPKKRRGKTPAMLLRGPAHDAFTQALERGVRQLGERHYLIDRAALELALANLGRLSSSVRVGPELRDGKPRGFRLFTVTADGPVARLGLRSGDVLVSANGLDIGTADRVLDAYGKLKGASHLRLGLVRGGREIVHEYTIR